MEAVGKAFLIKTLVVEASAEADSHGVLNVEENDLCPALSSNYNK